MKTLRILFSLVVVVLLSSCMTVDTVKDNNLPMQANQGYIAMVFDSRDNLSTVKIHGRTSNLPSLKISYVTKGVNLYLYQLPAGEYCLKEFTTAQVIWSISGEGDCFSVEAGKINYPGHIVPTPDGMYFVNNPWQFFGLLNAAYPVICNKHLLSLCKGKFLEEENGKYDFAMTGLLESNQKSPRRRAPKAGTRINKENDAVNTKTVH